MQYRCEWRSIILLSILPPRLPKDGIAFKEEIVLYKYLLLTRLKE